MERPVAIEVRDVSKGFTVPAERTEHTARERWRHPRNSRRGRRLEVLDGISFDVYQGEFFGIVGRNGSGKSTLLKLMASVYGTDRGRIRIAGRLAPFLELGVGFNPQMAAYENVILNGVMMGLTPDQAKARYEEIIDFAGLAEYTDLRLKNYSSGMKVRLAFAVMTQVDADILLMDEVLAVGDSEFQEKCEVVFREMREAGKTIVLVTHSMPTVNALCDRAMLLHDGRLELIGRPVEVSNRYLEINLRAAAAARGDESDFGEYAQHFAQVISNPPVRLLDAWLAGPDGKRTTLLGEGDAIEVEALAEVVRDLDRPGFKFKIDDAKGQAVFVGGADDLAVEGSTAKAGERLRIQARVDNLLAPGHYVFSGAVVQRMPDGSTKPATPVTALDFEVAGGRFDGMVRLGSSVTLEREASDEPAVR